jgi:DNA-nicking Smr family endonuclease
MPKKPKISADELAAFEEAVKGTRRYTHEKARLKPAAEPAKRYKRDYNEHYDHNLDKPLDIPTVSSEEFISFKQSSISEKILRKLRKGQYNVDATLDLHGMTVEQAKKAVLDFLHTCSLQDIRVALIIHGKGSHSGKPVLKNSLNNWLRKIETVLAFSSAKIAHGSRGAVYVLLKDSTEEKYV